MKSPLVTVYITNYNYGRFIRQSVESVLNQTMQDFELIIIDDGSTDNSKEIIESYADQDRISIIYQNNKGLNITNNIAMRAASGKYLMRLDADDYLEPNALEVLSNELESDDELGLVFPDYYYVDANGTIIGQERRHSFSKEVSLYDQPAHGACTMIRLDFLKALGGYNESFTCQDGYDLWIKFITHHKVNNINMPLFSYRQHGSNLTRNESRILTTRAKIKEAFIQEHNIDLCKTVGIIPVRSGMPLDLLSKKIDGVTTLLEWKVRRCLESKHLKGLVITATESDIITHFPEVFEIPGVYFVQRSAHSARINTDLSETVREVMQMVPQHIADYEAIMLISSEYPFVGGHNIDDAIHTLSIFECESVISVRPDNSLFFQHDGGGMKAILGMDKFTRLERDALYKYTGGITITQRKYFEEHKKFMGQRLGHIVISQKEAHAIFSDFDFEIARLIAAEKQPA